jgi:hypothetical protein
MLIGFTAWTAGRTMTLLLLEAGAGMGKPTANENSTGWCVVVFFIGITIFPSSR